MIPGVGGMVRHGAAVAALLAAFGGAAGVARAGTITAVPFDRFAPEEVTIDAGESVTFANRDVSTHDVVGDGFRSELTDAGKDAPVKGAEKLGGGRYKFFCSVHPGMEGTLVVRGGSSPPPPSDDPPPPSEQPPPPEQPADTTPPKVGVRVRAGLLRITVEESVLIEVRAGKRRIRRSTDGPATIRIRLGKRVRRVVVRVTDTAGNRRTVTRRVPSRR
ncbi:MAG TPA: cupredoxin domain-containing protein [Solirubrobacteraceae bacterium]|jgi:plastocyanin